MFERPKGGERTLLVQIAFPDIHFEKSLIEFEALALSAGAEIIDVVTGNRDVPEPKYFIGSGKVEEVRELVLTHDIQLVLVNHQLSPSQARNIERLINCRVVDRTGLILDIFAKQARTAEGKLQVELAQLDHSLTQLVRGWTHLERQKGGIGLRGPGETQLETDRRLIRRRIKIIQSRLEHVRAQREQNRSARKRSAMPTVSLVGYTNAGKSTLFNVLTQSEVFVADQLFATLDPSMRKLELPGASPIILIDTVGFIRDLPHTLVESFKATLEETIFADLLLHVIDASNPEWMDDVHAVETVLKEIGADKIPLIRVFNKIDLLKKTQAKKDYSGKRVWVSANTHQGLPLLHEAIIEAVYGPLKEEEIILSSADASVRAKLYAEGAVLHEQSMENGDFRLKIKLSQEKRKKILG